MLLLDYTNLDSGGKDILAHGTVGPGNQTVTAQVLILMC